MFSSPPHPLRLALNQPAFSDQQFQPHSSQFSGLANSGGSAGKKNISVKLENEDLWRRFNDLGTEMIITKTGRRMFPTVKVTAHGLEPSQHYFVLMDIVLAEDNRYKYSGKEWLVAGKAEPQLPARLYFHPDGPATGSHWLKHDISFHKVKLTNNNMDQNGHIVLTSMHKYHVRIHIVPASDLFSLQFIMSNNLHSTVTFTETKFLGVTAYQNERITQLKIDNNPFAKGFRENGHLRTKRKSEDQGHLNSTGTASQRSRTDSSGSTGLSGAESEEENDDVFNDEVVSPKDLSSRHGENESIKQGSMLSPVKESPVKTVIKSCDSAGAEGGEKPPSLQSSPSVSIKAEPSERVQPIIASERAKSIISSESVKPIISRPFQFPPPQSLESPHPGHQSLLYYHHLLSSPLLPYLPLYPPGLPPSPLSPHLPPSPGHLPPSPNYLAAEYIARNFGFNRTQR